MSIEYDVDTIIKRDDDKYVIHPVKSLVCELVNFISDDISDRDDIDHISFGIRLNEIDDSYINVVDALFEQVVKYFNRVLKGIDKDNTMFDKVCSTFDDYCEYHKIDHIVEGRVYYDNSIEYYIIDAYTFKPIKLII